MGIEPTCAAWKAAVLPLNYARKACPRCRKLASLRGAGWVLWAGYPWAFLQLALCERSSSRCASPSPGRCSALVFMSHPWALHAVLAGERLGVVGREGFEPSKAVPSDLQSDPFGHSGTSPDAGARPWTRRTPSLMLSVQARGAGCGCARPGTTAPDVHLVTCIAMEQTAQARLLNRTSLRAPYGASGGTRTPDRLITNQVLYQLSYTGFRVQLSVDRTGSRRTGHPGRV